MLEDLSIIIPVGQGETAWRDVLGDLQSLQGNAEVLVVGVDAQPEDFEGIRAGSHCHCRWLQSERGRAWQMNFGAENATRRYLWFLHADSRVDSIAVELLHKAFVHPLPGVYYFDLAFHTDGPRLMCLNAWGANLRSHYLGLPFGDQGLCLSRETFQKLGRFDEAVPYGEDHLLIWKAHCQGVAIRPIGGKIFTSARKYKLQGWFRTTLVHLWQTVYQALPQAACMIRGRRAL